MQQLTVAEIVEATGGALLCGNGDTVICSVTTNSREAKEGSLFVPLVGERVDGHKFISSAFANGASASITHCDAKPSEDGAIIRVEDTLAALGAIAAYYKAKYRIPTIAITGSVGKTTTKDIVFAALSESFCTVKTLQNFNNEIGVPWTIFSQEKEHKMAVVEMGMNHFGELLRLSKMVKPDAAIITNIGMSHIENLGSQEGILKAKLEVTSQFDENNTLIINGDDKMLFSVPKTKPKYKIITYGLNEDNDVYARDIKNLGLDGVKFVVCACGKNYNGYVSQPGEHNVYNALAAVCAAIVFGADIERALEGVANCEYTSGRLEIIHHKGGEIIKDCYNASPDAIKAALSIMPYSNKKRRVAVLGDVLEMGDFAPQAHYELGDEVLKNGVDVLITAGENSSYIAKRAEELSLKEIYCFATTEQAAEFCKDFIKEGDCVLVKASHGMHFEKIIEAIIGE